jgi:hypothetical protein
MNNLDKEFYNLQLDTNIAFLINLQNKNHAEFILKFLKIKIKNKKISKQLTNLLIKKLHLKQKPVFFIEEWNNRFSHYTSVSNTLKENLNKSDYQIISEFFNKLSSLENAPLSSFFQCGDLIINDKELERQIADFGYLEVLFSEKDKFDSKGTLVDYLEISFSGFSIYQMNNAIDLLNLCGLELLYPNSFKKFPIENKFYIKAKEISLLNAA